MRRRWRGFAARCRQRQASAMRTFRRGTAPARCAIMHRARTRFCILARLEALRRGAGGARSRSAPSASCTGRSCFIPATSAARSTARIRAWRCGFWPMTPISSQAIPGSPARSATNARCGRRCRPIPAWVNRQAVRCDCRRFSPIAHSSLLRVEEFRERLHRCAALLIAAGADVNQHIHSRWPPGSLSEPDAALSALGALRRGRKQP